MFVSRPAGVLPAPRLNTLIGALVNVGRSMPFVVLLIALIPITRWIIGTTLGSTAAIVPITLGAIPFFARVVEAALDEVDKGRVEAILSMVALPAMSSKSVVARGAACIIGGYNINGSDAGGILIHGWRDRWRWVGRFSHSLRLSAL